jgi:tetratricopeptide (TPR) repeat protein
MMYNISRLIITIIIFLQFYISHATTNQKPDHYFDSIASEVKANWMNNPDNALEIIDKAEQNYQKQPLRYAELVKFRGIVYYFKSDYSTAKNFYEESLRLYQAIPDSSGISALLNNLAIVAVETGEYTEAVKLYLQALEIAEKMRDKGLTGRIYLNLGNISAELDQPEQSLGQYLKSLEYVDSIEQKGFYASLLNNIGGSYSDLKEYDKAFEYHSRSLKMRREVGDSIPIAISLSNIGNVLVRMKQPKEAIQKYHQAIEIYVNKGYKKGLVSTYNYLGNCYLELGNHSKAREYLNLNINEAEALESGFWAANGYSSLATAYFKLGNYENAYKALLKYQTLNDSLQVDGSRRHMAELEKKYETQKKEAEIQRLNADKLQQEKKLAIRTTWFLTAIIAALVAIMMLVVVRYRQHRKTAALDKKNLEMENQLLRLQINPHFLFNSLNSIQYYMDKNPESASRYITKFARLTRLILEHSRTHWVNLSEEIEAMELYMEMEQLRLEKKFEWTVKIDDEIDAEIVEVPPMMFQPFIENAIKHGIQPLENEGKILIKILKTEEAKLKITITDNGVGIKEETKSNNHQSLGTQLTKERIALFEKQYKNKLSFQIRNLNESGLSKGTEVLIELPFRLT